MEFGQLKIARKTSPRFLILTATTVLFPGCSNLEFTHVKPGQSARLEVLVRQAPVGRPLPAQVAEAPTSQKRNQARSRSNAVAEVIPPLPSDPFAQQSAEKVAEIYARANVAMSAGKTSDAIVAFEEVTQVDPTFSDAWSKLAALYRTAGMGQKANDAAQKAKNLGQTSGSEGSTAASEGSLFPAAVR